MRLVGKVAIVTGGGSGIGETTAVLFGREGAKVLVADNRADAAKATVKTIKETGGTACPVCADVTKAADVEAMIRTAVELFGRLDILFNNAGVLAKGSVVDLSENEWDRVMDVNLKAVFLCCKYAIPEMIKNAGGSIIITSSIVASIGGLSLSCVYPATKAGVIGFCKDTAVKYARHNIRINCVCPGQVETPMVRERIKAPGVREALLEKYPLGRLGQPIDVAYAVLFLASDEASFITGTELIVDGGYSAQ